MADKPIHQKPKKNLEDHNLAKILNSSCVNRKYVYVFDDAIIRLALNQETAREGFKYIFILERPQGAWVGYQFKYDPTKPKKYVWMYSDKTQVTIQEIRGKLERNTMELLEELTQAISEKTLNIILFNINEV